MTSKWLELSTLVGRFWHFERVSCSIGHLALFSSGTREPIHTFTLWVCICVCVLCVCVCACIRDSVANVCCFIQRVLLTDWLYHDHSRRQVSVPVVSCLRIHDDVNKPPLAIRPLSHKQPVRHPDWNISTDSQGTNCFQFDRKSLLFIVYLLNFNLISRKA